VGAASAPAAYAQADDCPNAGLRTGPSAGLPGCRALELVSPADKVGGTGVGVWYLDPGAAGSAGYAGYGSPTDATVERFAVHGTWGSVLTDSAFSFANDWALAQRGASGWVSRPGATRGGYGNQTTRFLAMHAANDDLSLTTWRSNGGTLRLFPEMESWSGGQQSGNPTFVRDWEQGRWDLFGVTDPSQNPAAVQPALQLTAVSTDGSYAVGSGQLRGLAGAGDPTHVDWPDGFVDDFKNVYLFDLSGGLTDAFPAPDDQRRSLVNVCSAGTVIPQRLATGKLSTQPCPPRADGRDAALISPRGGDLGRPLERSISRDGSRVFFMSPDPDDRFPCSGTGAATACPAQLYVRQRNVDGSVSTRWVSRSRSVAAGGGAFGGGPIAGQDASLLDRALFEGASRDGSRVFFRSRSPLTPDDPNAGCEGSPPPCTVGDDSASSSDLYMYELSGGPDGDPATPDGDPGEGTLTRITAGPTGGSDCNSPFSSDTREYTSLPSARFVSEDGGRVYFVCDLPLTDGPGATNGTITEPSPSPMVDPGGGRSPQPSAANLYLYEAAKPVAERWRFVAQLPRSTAGGAIASCATTAASSGESLNAGPAVTQLNTSNCVRGTSDGSFVTFWTDGRLTADDDLDGVADIYAYDAAADELTRITRPEPGAVGGSYACVSALCHGDGGIGDGLSPLPALGVATDPAVAGERVAFFESRSRLVVEDTDDAYDVYQWKRAPGQPAGELSLLTPGDSVRDGQMYKGNDRSGRNVFFATRDRLTWQDHDAVLDVYSARVGGGIPAPVEPPACDALAGACHGSGSGPTPAAPTSSAPGGQNADPGVRARLFVGGLSRVQRRRAARRGVVVLRVRVSRPGRVVAVARARLGRRARVVGRAVGRLSRPGAGTLRVRLNRPARRRLRSGRGLRVAVRVRTPGALARTMRFTLRRSGR
jgi:hypothetical protein